MDPNDFARLATPLHAIEESPPAIVPLGSTFYFRKYFKSKKVTQLLSAALEAMYQSVLLSLKVLKI